MLLGAGIAYLASPLDLIPGIIPVLGQLDDLYIILTAVEKVLLSCPLETAKRQLEEASLTIEELEADLILIKALLKDTGRELLKATGKLAAGSLQLAGKTASGTFKLFKNITTNEHLLQRE